MKLTATQLKRIIKEELLKEAVAGNYKRPARVQRSGDRRLEERLEGLAADALEDFRTTVEQNALDEGQDEVAAKDLAKDSVEKLFADYMDRVEGGPR